eukprot:108438_1
MSWKKNRESYVVQSPNLGQLIGDEFQNGLISYHTWCKELLTIRYTSIALIFFVFGVFGIYLINLPIVLFRLNDIDYFSLSGLWNVICMVSILTVHLYFNSLHFKVSRRSHHLLPIPALNTRTWWSLFPLISYPFCALCCTSFYLQWIGIPFLVHNASSSNETSKDTNPTITIIQYSVLLLSYIYGYIPHELIYRNRVYFKSMLPTRALYVKQLLKNSLISNLLQTIAYCVFALCVWWIVQMTWWNFELSWSAWWNIFCILFRITWSINFLYIIGYSIMNRLLTEKVDMSRFNGYKYPLINNSANGRCIDIRLLALTQSHSAHVDKPIEREYFCYLALVELLDVVQYDQKQRQGIYSTQLYFNILVETLLAEYSTFIISLYEYIYGENNRNSQQNRAQAGWLSSTSFFGSMWYTYFTLKPEISNIFKNYELLIYAADILSFVIIHSLEEDELGIVQDSVEQILCVLLECLDILDIFVKCNVYRDMYPKNQCHQRNEVMDCLYKGIEAALMRIVVHMYKYLDALKLPQKNAQRLQSYLGGSN